MLRNNKLILETQQRFKRERHNVFTEEIYKIALSSNDDQGMQSIDSIETYAYGTSKDLVSAKEEIKCNNILKRCKKRLTLMMLQKKKIKVYNANWPQSPNHPYRLLTIKVSGSGKTNSLFDLINQQPHIDENLFICKRSISIVN